MKKLSLLVILLFIGIFLSTISNAQTERVIQYREHPSTVKKNMRYFTVGGFLAAMNYLGDQAPVNKLGSTSIPLTRPGLGLSGSYRLKRYLAFRGHFMWGRLRGDDITADKDHGDDKFRYTRNLHFRNDIKELSLDLVFDLSGHHRTFATRHRYTFYVFAGIALFHHNPKAKVPEVDALHYDLFDAQPIKQNDPKYNGVSPGDWIALKSLGTEGQNLPGSELQPYSNWQFSLPVGFGVRYRINRHYDFAVEVGVRYTFFDYLDDASTNFINPDAFGDGPKANLARLMADRSKEPTAAVKGEVRDLNHILENVHKTSPYGNLPAEFDSRPYELIDGFGRRVSGNIRGKEANDVYVATKFTFIYIFGKGFGYNKIIGP